MTKGQSSRMRVMRAVALFLVFSLSLLVSTVSAPHLKAFATGASSTEGTDFWLTFDSNLGAAQDLRIYLASSSNASVSISWPDGSTTSHSVAAGNVETVVADSYADAHVNRASQGTAANGIHITSDVRIAVYGAHIAGSTSDAFVAIPTTSLGTEYMLLSHPATIASYPGRFSLIAAEAGTTTVSITPSVGLAGGQTAGGTYSISLQQGEVYTSQSVATSGADISGTVISADKKLVVTSGVDCVNVIFGACDHVVQYIPPTVSWGKSFILPGSINADRPDRYRIVASEDGTTVSIDGVQVATLSSGQVHQFDPTGSNAQQTQLLETNKPALVGHFLGGGSYGGVSGDPAFSLISPSLQFLPSYNFATPASGFAVNTLTVVAATADVASVSISGVTLSAFQAVSGTNFSVSRTQITAGNYSISADSGIGIYVAGFNGSNSYSYPGGYALVDLIQNPGGVAEVLAASSLANLSTAGGDLAYEFSETGTSYFLVVDSDDTAPSASEVKAAVDYSGGTVLDSGSASTTANTAHVFSISGLTAARDYVVYTVTEYGGPAQLSTVSSTSFSTKPGLPSVTLVTAGDSEVSVAISPSSTETNFEYSTDGGSTWTARSSASVASPWVITGLTNGTTYSFQFRSSYNGQRGASTPASSVTPRPPAVYLSGLASSVGTLSPSFAGSTLAYSISVANSVGTLDLTPISAGNSITVAGSSVNSGQSSSPITLSVGSNTVQVSVVSSLTGAVATVYVLTVTRAAASDGGLGRGDEGNRPTPATPTPVVTPPLATPRTESPPLQSGPVLRNGVVPSAPKAPTASLGGRSVEVFKTVSNSGQLDVIAGNLSIGVRVQGQQGQVTDSADGTTQIEVRKGSYALVSGAGMSPGSTVQVFLPLGGGNAKELTRIAVNPDGSFGGSAPFATRSNEAPLPVGKNLFQLVSLDENGDQFVVEMTVNIAQGSPVPEQNRIAGAVPRMTPGQSIATSGGEPVPVTITPVFEQKLAVVEGDGWTMAINVSSEQGGVEPAEGGALLKLVRSESAFISGSGFMPGTRADVWLFSEPTLLGSVTVDEKGAFTGEFNIDPNMIAVGEHTLQLQAVGEDGYIKAANMGVRVEDITEVLSHTAKQSLDFTWWIFVAAALIALVVFLFVVQRRRED